MTSFTTLRSQIINLEKKTDQLLIQYSNYEKTVNHQENLDLETSFQTQLAETLESTNELIGQLSRITEFENLSTSKLQQLTRHKEIWMDHSQNFNKLKASIQDAKNRNNLLFSIRSDLNKRGNGEELIENSASRDPNDYILDESTRVNNFNSFANRLLQSAYKTRDDLLNQRSYLNNANMSIGNLIQQIPGINIVISKINTRRKRDTLILAAVISFCILFLFFV